LILQLFATLSDALNLLSLRADGFRF
jgi:hypothetical protein